MSFLRNCPICIKQHQVVQSLKGALIGNVARNWQFVPTNNCYGDKIRLKVFAERNDFETRTACSSFHVIWLVIYKLLWLLREKGIGDFRESYSFSSRFACLRSIANYMYSLQKVCRYVALHTLCHFRLVFIIWCVFLAKFGYNSLFQWLFSRRPNSKKTCMNIYANMDEQTRSVSLWVQS